MEHKKIKIIGTRRKELMRKKRDKTLINKNYANLLFFFFTQIMVGDRATIWTFFPRKKG